MNNADFGIKRKMERKQQELFPGWWEDVINEKKKAIYKAELEELRKNGQEKKTFCWIKNPATRVKCLKLNSDMKWAEYEITTKLVPITGGDSAYSFRSNAKTEVVEFEILRRKNEDLEHLSVNDYKDAGISHYDPPAMEMNRAHFDEMCTNNSTHVLAIYEKNHLDWKKDWWKDEEWFMSNLYLDYKAANKLAYAIERMELDRKSVAKLVHGYISDSRIEKIKKKASWKMKEFEKGTHMKAGMKAMAQSDLIYEFIDYLADLADTLPELKKNDFHSGETRNAGNPDEINWVREITKTLQEQVPDESVYEDRFNLPKDTVFGTHKLFYGEECCSHELLSYINGCNQEELNDMKASMMPQKSAWGGMKRDEYWYLTGQQKSQAWSYIWNRQKELNEANTIRIGHSQ